jgi:hypothetical protein
MPPRDREALKAFLQSAQQAPESGSTAPLPTESSYIRCK